MRTIYKIAKTELHIAYRLVVVVVFCFSNGVLLHGDA